MKIVHITLLLLFTVGALYAQSDDSVIVTGFGKTVDEAKYSAFNTAIEQALGVMVSSDILVENGELINDTIKAKSEGFIESYNIISTGRDKELYVVTMRAKVSTKKIQSQLDSITHLNDAKMSYDAVTCNRTPQGIMCNGGDLALGDMNFGIYDASYAKARFYTGKSVTEAQIYFSLTLRQKGYFYEVTDQNGKKYELKYVYMGNDSPSINAKTITEDFIVPMELKTLKSFSKTGLELTTTGSNKTVAVKIPPSYIEGFVKFIEENL